MTPLRDTLTWLGLTALAVLVGFFSSALGASSRVAGGLTALVAGGLVFFVMQRQSRREQQRLAALPPLEAARLRWKNMRVGLVVLPFVLVALGYLALRGGNDAAWLFVIGYALFGVWLIRAARKQREALRDLGE